MPSRTTSGLITDTTPTEYFQASIGAAMARQSVSADDGTVHYLVTLLTHFIHAGNLFDETDDGIELRPLAFLYADAAHSRSAADRRAALRRLGDVALFISGFFADSLDRKAVDIDYYIAMGGGAYGHLAECLEGTQRGRELSTVYRELAHKFIAFVDVLDEVKSVRKPAHMTGAPCCASTNCGCTPAARAWRNAYAISVSNRTAPWAPGATKPRPALPTPPPHGGIPRRRKRTTSSLAATVQWQSEPKGSSIEAACHRCVSR